MLSVKTRRLHARLHEFSLGDKCLNQQAVPLLGELTSGKLARVSVNGRKGAIGLATRQRGAGHLDQLALGGKPPISRIGCRLLVRTATVVSGRRR